MFPLDAAKSNFGGGFTDLLEVLACRFRGKVGASGAGVGMKPVFHSGLVFCGSVFVSKYVGDLSFLAVIGTWIGTLAGLRGVAWDAE